MRRTVAVVAGLAIVGAALVAAAPASAQSASYANSPGLTTPDNPSDLDITSIDVERSPSTGVMDAESYSAVSIKMHEENLPDDNYEVIAYFLRTAGDYLNPSTDAVIVDSKKTNGDVKVDITSRINGVTTTIYPPASFGIDAHRAVTTLDPSAFPWSGDMWGAGRIIAGGQSAQVGIPNGDGIDGFGPVNENIPTPTTTTVAVTPAQRVYGQAPATLSVTLTPAANGTVEVFDGAVSLATITVHDFKATNSIVLPNSLAIGDHAIHAVYTPDAPRFAGSTSASVILHVADPNPVTKTSTKLTLSKSKQHFRGKPARASVKVSGKHAGKVRIYDGKHKLTTLKLVKGKAHYTLSSKLSRGKHVLKVVYVPKHPASVAGSTSKKVTLKVVK